MYKLFDLALKFYTLRQAQFNCLFSGRGRISFFHTLNNDNNNFPKTLFRIVNINSYKNAAVSTKSEDNLKLKHS